MVRKVQRELWSTPSDALDLVSSLKDLPGCYVKWETDPLHRLKHVFWSTGQQQLFARQWGGIVIQDNTCLSNRCELAQTKQNIGGHDEGSDFCASMTPPFAFEIN